MLNQNRISGSIFCFVLFSFYLDITKFKVESDGIFSECNQPILGDGGRAGTNTQRAL